MAFLLWIAVTVDFLLACLSPPTTLCPEKNVPLLCQMQTEFQNSFINRLSSKFLIKQQLNIPSHLKRVATLPCETFVLKYRHALELSEANCHARLSHSKQLLKKYSPNEVSIISVHVRT